MNPEILTIMQLYPYCTPTHIGISVILLFSSSQTPDQTLPVISTNKIKIIRIKFFLDFLSLLFNLIECTSYTSDVAFHLKYLLNEWLSGQFVRGTGQRSEYNGYFVNMMSCPYPFNSVHLGTLTLDYCYPQKHTWLYGTVLSQQI